MAITSTVIAPGGGGQERGVRRGSSVAVALLVVIGVACDPPARLRDPVRVSQADPALLTSGGQWWAFGTSDAWSNIPQVDVTDLHHGQSTRDALSRVPRWARGRNQGGTFWAPSVARIRGRYVLYFSGRHRAVGAGRPGWCIGTAVSSDPAGPFVPADQPLLCRPRDGGRQSQLTNLPAPGRGVIDPHVYRQGDRVFLHFKVLTGRWQLWGVRLSNDGRRLAGRGIGMVEMAPQASVWEYSSRHGHTLLENPAMDHNPQGMPGWRHYLYYSGGDYLHHTYATGIAVCRTPLGPCLRVTPKPWLRKTRGDQRGPGGFTVTRDAQGRRWAAYHTRFRQEHRRNTHIEPFGYRGADPVLLNRSPSGSIRVQVPEPGTVTVSGLVSDPDWGGSLTVELWIDGVRRQLDPFARISYHFWVRNRYGVHRYCTRVRDDNGFGVVHLGCRDVDGGEPPQSPPPDTAEPPSSTLPPPTAGPTTSTAPTTTGLPPPTTTGPAGSQP